MLSKSNDQNTVSYFTRIWKLGTQIKLIKQPEDAHEVNHNFHSLPNTRRTKLARHIVCIGKK
jgi:hypothetical protein